MILSDVEFRKLLDLHPSVINPFNEERLQGASYDISLSNKLSSFNRTGHAVDLADQDTINCVYHHIDISREGYFLSPGEYILATIQEKITIPKNLCAHVRPRTRFTRMGILISGQHCNPGYSGILQIGIFNASPNTVKLTSGLHIAQLVFEELTSEPSEDKQYQNKMDSAYMNEEGFVGAVFDQRELSPNAKLLYDMIIEDHAKE